MNDTCKNTISGHVRAYLEGNGKRILVADSHNTILANTACALASLYAGNQNLSPSRVAFIAGSGNTAESLISGRNFMTKQDLVAVVTAANIEIEEFSSSPSLSTSTDIPDLTVPTPNITVFHSHTDPTAAIGGAGNGIVSVALMTGEEDDSLVLSLFTLNASGIEKREGLELAVDWMITFKEGFPEE